MRVLVTGIAGLLGSHLADELISQGHEVTGVDDLSGGFRENVPKEARFILGDLRKREVCKKAVKGQDIIAHLACYAAEGQSVYSPIEINNITLTPINNLLVEAVNQNISEFLFTSSMSVFGDQVPPFNEKMRTQPVDPYGIAKTYCENMLDTFWRIHDLSYTIIRPHNCYGPRQNLSDPYRNCIGIWMNRILKDKHPLIYGDGEQTRAFSYVTDTTKSIAKCINNADQQIINIGGKKPYSINEACQMVLDVTGSKLKAKHIPARQEVKYAYCTTAKSERLLGYKDSVTFEEGLRRMWEWAKAKGSQPASYRIPLEITKGAPEVWRKKTM
jgi:UDP-glucose 4-epimerase